MDFGVWAMEIRYAIFCNCILISSNFIFYLEQGTLEANEESSELLPDKWNDNSESYALRYVKNEKVCVLLATVKNETALLNFLVSYCVCIRLFQNNFILLFSFFEGWLIT